MAAKPKATVGAVSISTELSGLLLLIQEKGILLGYSLGCPQEMRSISEQCWVREPRTGARYGQWMLGWCVPAGREKNSRTHATADHRARAAGHGGEIKLWLLLKIAAMALLQELELSPHLHKDTFETDFLRSLFSSLWICFPGVKSNKRKLRAANLPSDAANLHNYFSLLQAVFVLFYK